jgi:hypothetical protein
VGTWLYNFHLSIPNNKKTPPVTRESVSNQNLSFTISLIFVPHIIGIK